MVALVHLPSLDGCAYCSISIGDSKNLLFPKSFHSQRFEYLFRCGLFGGIRIDGFPKDAEAGVEGNVYK